MEITFATKALRDLCESSDKLTSRFGGRVALAIQDRLADLRAASAIDDIVVGNPREVTRDGRSVVTINLGDGAAIVLVPNHLKIPRRPDSTIDWSVIFRVKILSIEENSIG